VTRERPSNIRSLQARIRNQADWAGLPYGRFQHSIAVAIVGEILRTAAADSGLAIKGGTSLELRFGTGFSRASKDLDAVIGEDFDGFFEHLQLALRAGWQGFAGTASRPEIIEVTALADRPRRFKVQLTYFGRSFTTIPVEIAIAEIDTLSTVDLVPGPDLASLGIPSVQPLPCLAVEHQAAQKLHACSQPDTEVFSNDRARDLVDLQLLESEIRERMEGTATVCRRVFDTRAMHSWPPKLTIRPGWTRIYAEAALDLTGVAPDVETAINRVQRLVEDLDAT